MMQFWLILTSPPIGLANPSVRSVINWHIQELEITIDNADMFRKDFEYYINKTRKRICKTIKKFKISSMKK